MTQKEFDALNFLYRKWRMPEGTLYSLGISPEVAESLYQKGYFSKVIVNCVPCFVITPAGTAAKLTAVIEEEEPDINEKASETVVEPVEENVVNNTCETLTEPTELASPVVEPSTYEQTVFDSEQAENDVVTNTNLAESDVDDDVSTLNIIKEEPKVEEKPAKKPTTTKKRTNSKKTKGE